MKKLMLILGLAALSAGACQRDPAPFDIPVREEIGELIDVTVISPSTGVPITGTEVPTEAPATSTPVPTTVPMDVETTLAIAFAMEAVPVVEDTFIDVLEIRQMPPYIYVLIDAREMDKLDANASVPALNDWLSHLLLLIHNQFPNSIVYVGLVSEALALGPDGDGFKEVTFFKISGMLMWSSESLNAFFEVPPGDRGPITFYGQFTELDQMIAPANADTYFILFGDDYEAQQAALLAAAVLEPTATE